MTISPGGIRIENLRKVYGRGDTAVEALKNVNMQVAPGEVVGLIGPSGSGKSTLLKCLGAIIEPTSGRITLGDEVIYNDGWTQSDLRALRRDRIGFVFQAPYLIPFLDVTDNVALLPMLAGVANAEARAKAGCVPTCWVGRATSGWRNPKDSGKRWMNGYVTGYGQSSSNSGNAAPPCSENCEPWEPASQWHTAWRPTAVAGGATVANS